MLGFHEFSFCDFLNMPCSKLGCYLDSSLPHLNLLYLSVVRQFNLNPLYAPHFGTLIILSNV